MVITCEHGGKRIPAAWRELFRDWESPLASHRGYDAGALALAKALAAAFAAPLLAATVSRLLVDLNRSIGHPQLHSAATAALPARLRRRIVERHYRPHRAQAEALIRQAIAGHGQVLHVAAHSFTAELDAQVRRADIGLLYDPARAGEADLCRRWQAALGELAPELVVRRNYPYAGKGDGLTSSLRRLWPADAYLGIELELNQKHVCGTGRPRRAVCRAIVDSLALALAGRRAAQRQGVVP